MQNRACILHQLEKGMQTATLLRLISEGGVFGGVFSCQRVSLPRLASLFFASLPALVFLVAASWGCHLGVLFLPKLPTVSIYSPSPSAMTKDRAFTV